MGLLETLRGLGLTMGGRMPANESHATNEDGEDVTRHSQRHYGWTTDEAKADAAREAGATVTHVSASAPAYDGWEVSFTEVWDD